jgi:hypothetical protein
MCPELAIRRHAPHCFSVIFGDLTAFQRSENGPASVAAPQCLG